MQKSSVRTSISSIHLQSVRLISNPPLYPLHQSKFWHETHEGTWQPPVRNRQFLNQITRERRSLLYDTSHRTTRQSSKHLRQQWGHIGYGSRPGTMVFLRSSSQMTEHFMTASFHIPPTNHPDSLCNSIPCNIHN